MKVYIAGPAQEIPNPEQIRTDIQEQNTHDDIEFVDPLEHEVDLDDPDAIVDTDIELIETCDAVFTYYWHEPHTWGTPAEMYHASRIMGIPVVVWHIGPIQEELPTWLRGLSDEIEPFYDDALNALVQLLELDNQRT